MLRNYVRISFSAIKSFVRCCIGCQRETVARHTTLPSPIIPSFIRERLNLDTIYFLEYTDSNNNRYLLIFIVSFSNLRFFPSLKQDSGFVLNILRVFFYTGEQWKIFHSDNESEFTSNTIKTFLEELNIEDV
ncbi:hypothetical protein CDIK_4260 [Cucumispora dikerogammari]|nr:hypothetical protein CDIK_4260 [Cucumispora dikerogammari]